MIMVKGHTKINCRYDSLMDELACLAYAPQAACKYKILLRTPLAAQYLHMDREGNGCEASSCAKTTRHCY